MSFSCICGVSFFLYFVGGPERSIFWPTRFQLTHKSFTHEKTLLDKLMRKFYQKNVVTAASAEKKFRNTNNSRPHMLDGGVVEVERGAAEPNPRHSSIACF